MAAEALVSSLIEQLVSLIRREAEKEIRLVIGVKKEIQNLKKTFVAINAVMVDADRKQIKEESVKLWLENLKDIAYDMEDVLEKWSFQLTAQKQVHVDPPRPMKEKVLSYLSSPCVCFKPLVSRHDVGHEIQHIRKRLDSIAKLKNDYKLVASNEGVVVEEKLPHRDLTSSVINVSETYGRDFDKDVIKSKLLLSDGSSSSGSQVETLKVPLVAVVGMGGLGKTTLAQMVYNDKQVVDHFEKKNMWWVCVSDPFDKVRLAKAIIAEADGRVPGADPEWNALHNRLSKAVKDKRFLLVLDDMWTEDLNQWEPFKTSLEFGAKGSWILVTTRSEKVAVMMNAFYIHHMGQLPGPDCWSLFSRIAFAGRTEEERLMLEEMGEEIVRKCKGVPLSIKTIAGLMHYKRSLQDWRNVSLSDEWQEQEIESKVLPALLLSYYALPLNLKRCFAHCAIFPKDYHINKSKLIKLWMAHGFLNSKERTDLEAIGEEYFDDLVMRSFFEDIRTDSFGNNIYCKMHDLMHDLAQFLSKNECLIVEDKITGVDSKKIRHLTTSNVDNKNVDFSSTYNANKLRTLKISHTAIDELFHHFTSLRVLDMSDSDLKDLPSEVGNLKHLRYLDLSSTNVETLPETLSNLRNLQTLGLTSCRYLCKLPEGMGKMTNLRHLCLKGTNELSYMPQGIEKLSNLRTLEKFTVSNMSEGCKLGELKDLNLLLGQLEINGLGQLANASEANEANLKGKEHLRFVTLDFYCDEIENVGPGDAERMGHALEGLQIHADVENFVVRHYLGSEFPSWMVRDSMIVSFKLRYLVLDRCEKCRQLPALGRLPYIEELHIIQMNEVTCIDCMFYGIDNNNRISFPKLKELRISGMASLVEWHWVADNDNTMPQLRELHLKYCPMLVVLPPLGKLKSLKTLTIYMVSVKHIGHELFGNPSNVQIINAGVGDRDPTTVTAFPKLEYLKLNRMGEMETWKFPVGRHPNIMPCLRELHISFCYNLSALPALGMLKSLGKLEISAMGSIKCIGLEFWGIVEANDSNRVGVRTLFPRLTSLTIKQMDLLEEWKLPVGEDLEIMPCLRVLSISDCKLLKALPALGQLKSLERLIISLVKSVKRIGHEFWGIMKDNDGNRVGNTNPITKTSFPMLLSLALDNLQDLEEWEFPTEEDIEIMPCLRELRMYNCTMRALPPLGKLKSLEKLEITGLDSIKHIGLEFWGISVADCMRRGGDGPLSIIAFPKLEQLEFHDMEKWEEWEMLPLPRRENNKHDGGSGEIEDVHITMPCLKHLSLSDCLKLKVIPRNISSSTPWKLEIKNCSELQIANTQSMLKLQELAIDGKPVPLV